MLLPVWLERSGYRVSRKPYELNLVGFRANSTKPNSFNDAMKIFWFDKFGIYHEKKYQITTDPGTYWLNEPMNANGTAMLAGGQYIDCWSLGYHKGEYRALVQTGEMRVYRDYDRDSVLDFDKKSIVNGRYGINFHRASRTTRTLKVDKYSAGCQVFADPQEFDEFIELCELSAKLHGNKFTYTLIDERMYARSLGRRFLYYSGACLLGYAALKLVKA